MTNNLIYNLLLKEEVISNEDLDTLQVESNLNEVPIDNLINIYRVRSILVEKKSLATFLQFKKLVDDLEKSSLLYNKARIFTIKNSRLHMILFVSSDLLKILGTLKVW